MQATDRIRFKGGWGKYTQVVNRVTREDRAEGNQAFWTLSDGNLVPAATATHVVGGASYETDSFLVDVELYRKSLDGLSEFAPRLRPGEEAANSRNDFFHGTGLAKGVEVLVQKKFGRHTGWASYTLGRVEHDFPDLEAEPFPASHDQTHEFKLVDSLRLGNWTLASTWIYATGKPYTAPTGVTTVSLGDFSLGAIDFGAKNGARLPAYHRLDVALNYGWQLGGGDATAGLSIFNLYDRRNIWYKLVAGCPSPHTGRRPRLEQCARGAGGGVCLAKSGRNRGLYRGARPGRSRPGLFPLWARPAEDGELQLLSVELVDRLPARHLPA